MPLVLEKLLAMGRDDARNQEGQFVKAATDGQVRDLLGIKCR